MVKVATRLAIVVASLLVIEVTLHVGEHRSLVLKRILTPPWVVTEAVVSDERLVARGNPLNPEHDERGYRNRRGVTRADIVVLGDSQAYGPANPQDAWPRVLARSLNREVYNMSLPKYAPGQSLLQLDEALTLKPGYVIVAPYLGNDFYGTFLLARRHPELAKSVAPALFRTAEKLEDERPLGPEVMRVLLLGQKDAPEPSPGFVSRHVKLYGIARAVRWYLTPQPPQALLSRNFQRSAAALTPAQRQYVSPFSDTEWRTVLTARYRGAALDDRDPRIRTGFEVARDALLAIQARCRLAGVRLLVVLTPTKELVFAPRVKAPAEHPGLEREVADETRLSNELKATLREHGIDHIDLVEPLRTSPRQPYYEDIDGHLNVDGHALVGKVVAEHLTASAPAR